MTKLILLILSVTVTVWGQTKVDWERDIKNKPEIGIKEFNWVRTIGVGASGNLGTSGAGKVVTLTPCPRKIAESLRVSGGVGTEEVAVVTGTTCTDSAVTGTVTITTVNSHSGATVLSSATGGIQEAIDWLPAFVGTADYGGGTVRLPQGTIRLYTSLKLKRSWVAIKGSGIDSTLLYSTYKSGPLVIFDGTNSPGGMGDRNEIRDLGIEGDGLAGTHYGLELNNQSYAVVENVAIQYTPGGIKQSGYTNSHENSYRHINILNFTTDGIHIDSMPDGGKWFDISLGGDGTTGTNGVHIVRAEGGTFTNLYTLYCGNGVHINPSSNDVRWVKFINVYLDASESNALAINPTSTGRVIGVGFTGSTTAFTQNGGHGVVVGATGTVSGLTFDNHTSIINEGHGYWFLGGEDVDLINCRGMGNSAAVNNTYDGLAITGGNRFNVTGGTYAQAWSQVNSQRTGMSIGAVTNIKISNAIATPNLTATLTTSSPSANITNVMGYNPVGISIVTPGASPWTHTAGSSPEVLYFYGGTVTTVVKGGASLPGSPVYLAPYQSVVITYSVVPTSVYKDIF